MAENVQSSKNGTKKFYKSRKDRMIDGVCSGLADYLGIDPVIVRVLWLLSIFLNGLGAVAYILAMIIVPANPEHKNLKKGETRKNNPALIWGIILIVIGFIILYDKWDFHYRWGRPIHFFMRPWWGISWDAVWPLILIALGVVYIVFIIRKDKNNGKVVNNSSNKTRNLKIDTGHKLYRTPRNKVIGGVCGGFAQYINTDPTIIRIGYVVLTLITNIIVGIVIYVVLFMILPEAENEKKSAEKKV